MRRAIPVLVIVGLIGLSAGVLAGLMGIRSMPAPVQPAQAFVEGFSPIRETSALTASAGFLGARLTATALTSEDEAKAQVEGTLPPDATVGQIVVRYVTRQGVYDWRGSVVNYEHEAMQGTAPDDPVWLVAVVVDGGLRANDVHGFAPADDTEYAGAWVSLLASDGSRTAFGVVGSDLERYYEIEDMESLPLPRQ